MTSLRLLGLTVAGCLALAGPLAAQTKVKHPDGKLPTDLVMTARSKIAQPIWLAYEGFQPRASPDLSSEVVDDNRKTTFMERFYFVANRNEEDFHLLVTTTDYKTVKEYVGWVPGRYLVKKNEAVKDEDTGIMKKALIVNKRESLGTNLNELMIRYAPRGDAPGRDEPNRLYTTMFVYGEADGYVLVGDTSGFSNRPGLGGEKKVLGWLPRNRIAIWNTREAVEWDSEATLKPEHRPQWLIGTPPSTTPQRTTPGRIYETVDQARMALKDSSSGGLFEEDFEVVRQWGVPFKEDLERLRKVDYKVSPPLPHDAPRFPVLRRVEGVSHPGAGILFEVGGIGALCDARGRPLLSSRGAKQFQNLLEQLKQQVTQTDILFIIDDTESMDKWFPAVASTVRKITDLATADPSRTVRVGVTFYNDVTPASIREKREPVNTKPLQDVTKSGEEMAGYIQEHKPVGGGDPHEMVFRGIVEGIDKADFRPRARKMVVVIGDCGDISAEMGPNATPEYRKDYSIARIIERLIPDDLDRQTPLEFYAIQVIDAEESKAAGDFRIQMKEIVKQYAARLKERRAEQLKDKFDARTFHAPADYFNRTANPGTSIEDTLAAQYTRLLAEARQMDEAMKRLQKGQWLTTKLTPEMERLIDQEIRKKKLAVTLEQLKASNGMQLFQIGYVWKNTSDGLPLVRERIFVNGWELKELIDLLSEMEGKDGKEKSVREIVAEVIEKQANTRASADNDPELLTPARLNRLAMKDLLKMGTGLQFNTSIMNRKILELKDKDVPLQDSEFYKLKHRCDLLQDIQDGKACRYKAREVLPGVTKYERHGERPEYRRGYSLQDDSVRWYYLDYEREWP
jgi:hypothetical protein